MLRAADIHGCVSWPAVLEQLGVPDFGTKKARPCPLCGGRDRFVPDNRRGRGDYFCRVCGPGDGFALLMKLHGWSFAEARRHVIEVAGIDPDVRRDTPRPPPVKPQTIATPPARVRSLLRTSCAVADCADALAYLKSRKLWPLPPACALRAHPSVEYWADGQRLGRYPALIAVVHGIAGEL